MSTVRERPQTLLEAVRYFSDPDTCHAEMVRYKWQGGKLSCPKCGGDQIGEIKSRRMSQCKAKGCRKQFSAKVGTIFEDSPLGLDKWFVCVWVIANCKNGISSCEVSRALGVTQKTAWHMLHRIRLAMKTRSFKAIVGEIEGDEPFVGGKAKSMHKGRRKAVGRATVGKVIVQGLLQRGGDVRCTIALNQKTATLQAIVRANVEPGATLYTDTLASYRGLHAEYIHQMVDHAKCYVEGRVHTNGMENFWSLLKRGIAGTYVAVAPVHLIHYVDEQAYRFKKRKGTDYTRFVDVIGAVTGRRLTYAELTGKDMEMPNPAE